VAFLGLLRRCYPAWVSPDDLQMRRACSVLFLLLPLALSAAASERAYQDGVLTKVRTTVVDNACSNSTQSDAATYGNTARRTIDASARCSDIRGAVYTVQVGDTAYELTPDHSRVARASSYLPLSATLLKQSSLANHMPGTAVQFRTDDDGFLVRVGKRESHYRAFVAH
jgi:hypothetical protein